MFTIVALYVHQPVASFSFYKEATARATIADNRRVGIKTILLSPEGKILDSYL